MPDQLPCGCRKSTGYACPLHRPQRWWEAAASDPLALVSLALFVSLIFIVASIFE